MYVHNVHKSEYMVYIIILYWTLDNVQETFNTDIKLSIKYILSLLLIPRAISNYNEIYVLYLFKIESKR